MFNRYSRAVLSRASKIVTVSKFTKTMLDRRLIHQNKESILIPNVIEKKKSIPVAKKKIALCIADYTKPHKNWIETFSLLRFLKGLGYRAVVVSKPSDNVIENLKEIGGVLKTGINKEEIQALYEEAELYLNVSKYEGFGIPLVEAAYSGCKILCSDLEVFHEILDGYDYLVVPADSAAIKSYLVKNVARDIDKSRYSLNNMQRRIKGDIL